MMTRENYNEPPLVLIVDDDPGMRLLARVALEQAHFVTAESEDGVQALAAFKQLRPDIVLLDLMMPEMDGFAACAELRRLPESAAVPILVMTGLNDEDAINKAYEVGATDFIHKPINWTILGHRVRYMVRAGRTFAELKRATETLQARERFLSDIFASVQDGICILDLDFRIISVNPTIERWYGSSINMPLVGNKCHLAFHGNRYVCERCPARRTMATGMPESEVIPKGLRDDQNEGWLELYSFPLLDMTTGKMTGMIEYARDITQRKHAEEALRQSLVDIRKTLNETVNALATATELRDPYTAGHQKRVAHLSSAIAAELGFSEERVNGLQVIGFLHDIGKIVVPAEILNRPGKISEYEMQIVRTHPQAGYDILKKIDFPWPVAQAVLQHHERLDGSGYPAKLKGQEIILEARILAVADVVEAMASHRPYRAALKIEEALEEISKNKGSLYDPEVVDVCLKLFTNKAFNFE
jgi:PAS domain S-box-containing protein/putative nucleotidyltransferase with HDIG domain